MRHTSFLLPFLLLLSPVFDPAARGADQHWVEVTTPHFTVLSDANEKQARHVAGQFERMRGVFHTLFPTATADTGAPIVVLALRNRQDFQSIEPEAYLGKGKLDLAGLFLRAPDKNYILLRLDAEGEHPFATVYHEYTHLMLSKADEWLPLWLNEGLAEFYQNTQIDEKDALLGQASTNNILYLRQERLIPLPVLFAVDHTSSYYHEDQKGSVFYAESWALVHYLTITDREKNTHRLQDYTHLLASHVDPALAAQQAFGDLKQLEKALAFYVQQGSFKYFKMDSGVTIDESTLAVKPISNAEADASRADVLVYNGRTKDAQALLETTLRDDPNSALAHESMGFLKFREGDFAAARKWYGDAVKLDSHSYLAHYYYAAMSMQSQPPGQDSADIETSLRTAIKLNPTFAPSYDALANYYVRSNAKLSEAHLLNAQAIQLDPANLNFRLNAANVLMQMQNTAGAASVLKAAAKVAKTPEETAMVQQRIEQVEQFQASIEQAKAAYGDGPAREVAAGGGAVPNGRVTKTLPDGSVIVFHQQVADSGPKYPTEEPTGARHTAKGILRNVACAYPKIITLTVDESGAGKTITLYRNDLFQIDFTATNFTPEKDINACKEIEGMKAKVEYAEVSDKSIGGQILSIELTK
jgi:tetratricopeptide (TPR) repeat protein